MFLSRTLSKSLASLALLVSTHSFAAEVPPGSVTIKSISVNGSGCPIGTTAQNISDDKTAFTLTFSEFVAEVSPGSAPALSRRNCLATLVLAVPAGWQFSVGSFYYRGFMSLDKGIRATHATSYFFEGQGGAGNFAAVKDGPRNEDFVFTDKVGLTSVNIPNTWSSCEAERALNINTSIRVANTNAAVYKTAQGLITNDSIDGEIKQVYGLIWRRCL